jgi:uncharacterized protein YbjT (DUF2867 family)
MRLSACCALAIWYKLPQNGSGLTGGKTVILVIGGRSRTGQELTRQLVAAGNQVRVLTRTSEPAPAGTSAVTGAPGVETVTGDLARPDTLDEAMAGVDQVFLLCGTAHDELAWTRNGIDAAARAGVRHLVVSSILGSNSASKARFVRHHGEADAHVVASGVPYTILRPNMYMHNVTSMWPATIGPDGNYYAPAGDSRISAIDARDVAAVAAQVLAAPQEHLGQAYDLTGPAALDTAECCELLGKHLGRAITYVPVDDDAAHGAMLGAGLPRWMADALVELYQDYRRSGLDGYAAQVSDSVRAVTGRSPRTLDQALTDDLAGPGQA